MSTESVRDRDTSDELDVCLYVKVRKTSLSMEYVLSPMLPGWEFQGYTGMKRSPRLSSPPKQRVHIDCQLIGQPSKEQQLLRYLPLQSAGSGEPLDLEPHKRSGPGTRAFRVSISMQSLSS